MHTAADIFDDVLLFILSAQAVVDFDLQSNIIPRTKSLTLLSYKFHNAHNYINSMNLNWGKKIIDVIKTSIR